MTGEKTYCDSLRTYHVIYSDGRVASCAAHDALRALKAAPVRSYPPVEVLVCTPLGVQKLEGVLP